MADQEQSRKGLNILIVDDEREYRLLLGGFLQHQGWSVVSAEHGQEALDKLRESPIDIVITDIYMPVMDGLKFHRAVRASAQFSTIPFLFVSAYDDQYTLDAVKNPRLEAFMRKGRTLNELKEWVEYLTTPYEKRPTMHPGERSLRAAAAREEDRTRLSSRNPKRR